MTPVVIPNGERITHPLSLRDRAGSLFRWNGRLMREIRPDHVPAFERLWSSGLLQALLAEGLISPVALTEFRTEEGGWVLAHDDIGFVTYPSEWSFSMLRSAAAHTLRVNEFAARFGYELKDAHTFNILFDGTKPRFVDLGSFVPRAEGAFGWPAEGQFRAAFLNVLRLWSQCGPYVARRLLVGGPVLPDMEAFRLHSWLSHVLPTPMHAWHRRWSDRKAALFWMTEQEFSKKAGAFPGSVLRFLRRRRLGPFRRAREQVLMRQLQRVRPPPGKTVWGGYHENFRQGLITPRVERIVDLIRSYGATTLLDVGCNEGEFAFRFLRQAGVGHVVALDADPSALDRLYLGASAEGLSVTPVLSDAVVPLLPLSGLSQEVRWRVDVVVALAISHHLILSEEYGVDVVLKRLAGFSRRHLVVEFMPLGLWNGKVAPPIPEWYRVDWFRAAFSRHCVEVVETPLEENRILFSGRVRADAPG